MKNNKTIVSAVLAGGLLGFIVTYSALKLTPSDSLYDEQEVQSKPLYWVAPMDSNYRRDKPGKSPMGMDLIPVYPRAANGSASKGTVKISPEIVNNLGVRTATVQKERLNSEIQTVGYVKYNQDKLLHIHPRVEGWVEKLHVKASGDPVEAEQALYDIYSPDLVNAQQEYLVALERNRPRLIKASENRLRALQIPLSLIKNLKKTRQVQQKVTFYAPQSGIVASLNIREGFFVKPGTTMMSIGDLSDVWVQAEIFERQASLVALGDKVSMTLGYLPNKQWHGQIDYIYPTLDANTRTVKLRLRFPNKKGLLKPNMFAQVRVHTPMEPTSLIIPKEAVIRTGQQDRVVLALGEGQFKSVEVQLGRQDNKYYQIIKGLKEGEKIVISAQFLIDSESSKTSDFMRMDHTSIMQDKPTATPSASTQGVINNINKEERTVNISREAIEKWDRPATTLNFILSEALEWDELRNGETISFDFEIENGNFIITQINNQSKQ